MAATLNNPGPVSPLPLKYWLVTHKVRPLPRPPPPGVLPGARVREPAGLKIRYDMTMTDMYILYQAGI